MSRMSHVAVPWGCEDEGNWAASCVRSVRFVGVSASRWRSERVGRARGMVTGSGPRKMAFSVLARTEVKRKRRLRRVFIFVIADNSLRS